MSESKIEEIKLYYNNGKLRKHYYKKDGKRHGEYKQWCINGQILRCSFHEDGKINGECKWWRINGQIGMHAFYLNDKLHGECKWWYRNGKLKKHTFYKNDIEIDKYTWECLVKIQRSYRIKYNLNKYLMSKAFVEWWYHPDMPGGKAAKRDLKSFVESL